MAMQVSSKQTRVAGRHAVLGLVGGSMLAVVPLTPLAAAIEEIRVTATRREATTTEIPYNISAVSGTTIERASMVDAPELIRSVPGMAMVDRGPRNAAVVNGMRMRGINVDSSALGDYTVSAVSTVATYFNDTPIFANFALHDLERVEVLRGPQGTLYGSGALGGRRIIKKNKPVLGSNEVRLSGTASRANGSDSLGWATTATANAALGETMAFRITASYTDYPGITDYRNLYVLGEDRVPLRPDGVLLGFDPSATYVEKEDEDTMEQSFVRAALRWEPSDTFDATLTYQWQDDDYGGRRQETFGSDGFGVPYDDFENGAVIEEPAARKAYLASLEANLDLGFATLTSSSSLYDHEGDSVTDNTGFLTNFPNYGAFYYSYPRPLSDANREYGDEAFVQELRLVTSDGGSFDYVAGAFYMDQDLVAEQQNYLRGFQEWYDTFWAGVPGFTTGDVQFEYSREENFKEFALFGELTWYLSDTLQVTGGLRYFDNEAKTDTYQDFPLYTFVTDPASASFETDESDVLFKVNVAWDVTSRDMVYATFSQGFRRGGANAVPVTGRFPEDPAWLNYDSDSLDNYEVGIKGLRDRLRYNVSAFFVDWEDPQLNTETTTYGFYAVQNGGEAQTYGLELEVDHYLTDRLHYQAGYAYVNAEVTETAYAPDDPDFVVAQDGKRLPGSPEHMLNFAIDYTQPVLGGDASWFVRLDGYYQSDMENTVIENSDFESEFDEFVIVNAVTTLTFQRYDASLWIKNITDEPGITGRYTAAGFGTRPDQNFYGNTTRDLITLPRTVGVTFNVSF